MISCSPVHFGESGVVKEIQLLTSIFRESSRRYGCRRVGIEVERIAFTAEGKSLPYDGDIGARTLLETLSQKLGWAVVNSTMGLPIGLSTKEGKVSLEPGSQLEFSTEPVPFARVHVVLFFDAVEHERVAVVVDVAEGGENHKG